MYMNGQRRIIERMLCHRLNTDSVRFKLEKYQQHRAILHTRVSKRSLSKNYNYLIACMSHNSLFNSRKFDTRSSVNEAITMVTVACFPALASTTR